MTNRRLATKLLLFLAAFVPSLAAQGHSRETKIRDLVSIEGVRENSLVGYGVVVGLNGTGDRSQTIFTTQTLANALQRMGLQVPAAGMRVNNVAAVFVTANLPLFARPGEKVDVTVSSIGDAKTLEGGILLLTPLRASDGQVYASAQGPLTLGGYSAGQRGNSKQVNHPTVGRVPEGGTVERDPGFDLSRLPRLSLLLREEGFSSACSIASVINRELGQESARVVDGRRIDITVSGSDIPALMARIEGLEVAIERKAKVVVNERTGTVVMGGDIRMGAVSVLHGNLSIEVSTEMQVSQPQPFSNGETTVVPQTKVRAQDSPVRTVELKEGARVEQLVNGLQAIGATARDVVAILQAMKAAGALDADLEVI